MSTTALFLLGATLCAAAVPALTRAGLRALGVSTYPVMIMVALGVAGAGFGVACVHLAATTATLASLPGLMFWGCGLLACAACAGKTRRMPTVVLRSATMATAVSLGLASLTHGELWPLVRAILTAGVCWALLWLGWKLGSLGRADARLAALGGLGLGWLGLGGLASGVLAFALLAGLQVLAILMRGGNRHSHLPYGPALSAGFLAAALALI